MKKEDLEQSVGKQVKVRNSGRHNGIYTLEKVYYAPSGVLYCNVAKGELRLAVPFFDVVAVDEPEEMTESEKYFYSHF